MKKYLIRFTPEASRLISQLHPDNKRLIKNAIELLQQNPQCGDDLQEELEGFKSFKPKRYRILYTIDDQKKTIQIYYVGHRKDVYHQFRLLLDKLNK